MKLIDKDALLAEIKKLKGKVDDRDAYSNGWQHALRTAEIDIDSLEVKEVDLVKEYDKEYFNDPVYGKLVNRNAGIGIAKHFFELGMAVSNKTQKGE